MRQIKPPIRAKLKCALKARDGTIHHLPPHLDLSPLTEQFRSAVLTALKRRGTITEEFYTTLAGWDHGGFSTDASVLVPPGDTAGLERVAAYVLRPPLSLQRLTYESVSKTAIKNSAVPQPLGSSPRSARLTNAEPPLPFTFRFFPPLSRVTSTPTLGDTLQ